MTGDVPVTLYGKAADFDYSVGNQYIFSARLTATEEVLKTVALTGFDDIKPGAVLNTSGPITAVSSRVSLFRTGYKNNVKQSQSIEADCGDYFAEIRIYAKDDAILTADTTVTLDGTELAVSYVSEGRPHLVARTPNCKALTDVYYGGSETDWNSITIGSSNTPLKNAAIHYSSTCGTNVYWFLSDGVLTIFGSGAMKDYTTTSAAPWASQAESIQSVAIQPGVKSIGNRAFYSCSNLSEVSLPSGVESIGSYAFGNCSSLATITIPASVTSISLNPFIGCSSLTATNVNSSNPNYTSVDGVLYNKDKTTLIACPSTKSGVFTVPSGVKTINNNAFTGCTKLTSVLLPAGLEKIYNYARFQHHVWTGTVDTMADVRHGDHRIFGRLAVPKRLASAFTRLPVHIWCHLRGSDIRRNYESGLCTDVGAYD